MASSAQPELEQRQAPEPLPGRLLDSLAPAPEDDDEESPRPSSRLVRVAGSLLQVHAQIAQQELQRDQGRILRGVVLLSLGTLLVAMVLALLQVACLLWLHGRGLSWPLSALALAGADAALGGLSYWLGARALRQPVMPQTRSLIRRTVSAILSP